MQRQQRTDTPTAAVSKRPRRRRSEYRAAVRFLDGSRNIYEISNARDTDDARRMILEELSDVASAVIIAHG